MQSSDRVLAWRYARALFDSACEAREESRVHEDLSSAYGLILKCLPLLKHPRIDAADKKKKLDRALGKKVSVQTLRFLKLLIDKKRFELLPMIAANFGKQLAEKNNSAKAYVRASAPLSADADKKLKETLKNFAGKNIELEVKIDPEILGGVVVRLGDWVLDSSLRGKLRMLSKTLANEAAA